MIRLAWQLLAAACFVCSMASLLMAALSLFSTPIWSGAMPGWLLVSAYTGRIGFDFLDRSDAK